MPCHVSAGSVVLKTTNPKDCYRTGGESQVPCVMLVSSICQLSSARIRGDLFAAQSPFLQGLVYRLATDGQGAIPHGLLRLVIAPLQGQNLVGVGKRRLPIGFL